MADTATAAIDLHGHEGLIFPNCDEDYHYLERLTVPSRNSARMQFADEFNVPYVEIRVFQIHMRYVTRDELDTKFDGLGETGWWECEADHPDAVPFWKEGNPVV